MNLDDLQAQYLEMSYEDLLLVKSNAVLSPDAMDILNKVIEYKNPKQANRKPLDANNAVQGGTPGITRQRSREDVNPPFLTTIFYALAALGLLGGIILCVTFWPDKSTVRALDSMTYSPSIAWLTVGIVEAALFSAIGLGLSYLKAIHINTKST